MLREKLREVIKRNTSLVDLEEDALKLLTDLDERGAVAMLVAGSVAKGEFVRGMSDIDILVVVNGPSFRSWITAIGDVNVEVTEIGIKDILEAIRAGNNFIEKALEDGVALKGEEYVEHLKQMVQQINDLSSSAQV
jgi:predicted nucleotidyltransferase